MRAFVPTLTTGAFILTAPAAQTSHHCAEHEEHAEDDRGVPQAGHRTPRSLQGHPVCPAPGAPAAQGLMRFVVRVKAIVAEQRERKGEEGRKGKRATRRAAKNKTTLRDSNPHFRFRRPIGLLAGSRGRSQKSITLSAATRSTRRTNPLCTHG